MKVFTYVGHNQNLQDRKNHRRIYRQEMEHLRENAEVARGVVEALRLKDLTELRRIYLQEMKYLRENAGVAREVIGALHVQ